MSIRQLIEDLRGGAPDKCDRCGKVAEWFEPDEGGLWLCEECVRKEYQEAREERERRGE